MDCIIKDGNTSDLQGILDVSLYACTFTNQTYAGLLIENDSNIEINQCQFHSTTIGCAVGELSHVTIDQSSFNNGVIGLYTFLGGNVQVTQSQFTHLDRGLFSSGNSFIDLTQDINNPLTHCWQINNSISNNFIGCELETPSRQVLGVYDEFQAQGHELDFIGFNRLYSNSTDIFNPERNSFVKAQGNSWTNQSTLAEYTCEDGTPNITGALQHEPLPTKFVLHAAYPNPFNPKTTIKYELPEPSEIMLQIFDITGRVVTTLTDNDYMAGTHSTQWNGTNQQGEPVSSGMYFVRLNATSTNGNKSFTQSQKIVLLK